MKVFIWFAKNELNGESLKIYAVAPSIELARAQVERIIPKELYRQFERLTPQAVFDTPWAEVNQSGHGKAQAYYAGHKLGGS